MARLLGVALALWIPCSAVAQISAGGTPPGLEPRWADHLTSEVPVVKMPPVDLSKLLAEDEANAGRKDIPWRFGHPIHVHLNLANAGAWETLPGGDRVWRLGIRSPGALSLNLAFDRYDLPPGAELFVRSADGETVLGAFTEANNKPGGHFATSLVPGDELVLEYREPAAAPFPGELSLISVTHGYRDVTGYTKELGESGPCNHNVHCPPLTDGWDDPVRSVVMLTTYSSGFCTGVMLNNTSGDGTPYLLTASHCYSDPSYWVFWFNWESPDCDDPLQPPPHDGLTGATLVARDSSSDFALLELSAEPPPDYAVYLAGWDQTGALPSAAASIHHPSGDIKKITLESSQISPAGSYWDVGPWDVGTTEGGSSGAPLFDQDHRVIGQLFGGGAACAGQNPNGGIDSFGRFDRSWNGNDADERLRDWLDPLGLDPDTLDGLDPNTPLAPVDAAVHDIDHPADGSTYCTTPVPVEITLKNQGSELLTSVDVEVRVDGGEWMVTPWTGSLDTHFTDQVVLTGLEVEPGSHAFDVRLANPNGTEDGNGANDESSASFGVAEGTGLPVPLVGDFEAETFPPDGWSLVNGDEAVAWTRNDGAGAWGNGAAAAWFDNFDEEHLYESDTLMLPRLDLSAAEAPLVLEFDLAYARWDSEYWDQLQVQLSVDCGQSWDVIYDDAGAGLATAEDHEDPFVPEPGEWEAVQLALDAAAGEPNVLLGFVNISGWGNDLWVDNVRVHGGPSGDDGDGDGYSEAAGDCDDGDPSVHPGTAEVCEDGLDNDCDGALDDQDSYCVGGGDDDDDDTTGDDDDTTDDPADDDDTEPKDDGGCRCRLGAPSQGAAMAPLVILGFLVALRRVRRQ